MLWLYQGDGQRSPISNHFNCLTLFIITDRDIPNLDETPLENDSRILYFKLNIWISPLYASSGAHHFNATELQTIIGKRYHTIMNPIQGQNVS